MIQANTEKGEIETEMDTQSGQKYGKIKPPDSYE